MCAVTPLHYLLPLMILGVIYWRSFSCNVDCYLLLTDKSYLVALAAVDMYLNNYNLWCTIVAKHVPVVTFSAVGRKHVKKLKICAYWFPIINDPDTLIFSPVSTDAEQLYMVFLANPLCSVIDERFLYTSVYYSCSLLFDHVIHKNLLVLFEWTSLNRVIF